MSLLRFANLIGIGVKALRKWASGSRPPHRLGEILLELLETVLEIHPRALVVGSLRNAGPDPLSVVRVLTWLERHTTISEPVTLLAVSPASTSIPEKDCPEWVKGMRAALGVSQQRLADLLGFSDAPVVRWENGRATPMGLAEVILVLLSNALNGHPGGALVECLGKADGARLVVVRALAWLERHPSVIQPVPVIAGPLPPSTRPPPIVGPMPALAHRSPARKPREHRHGAALRGPPTKPSARLQSPQQDIMTEPGDDQEQPSDPLMMVRRSS